MTKGLLCNWCVLTDPVFFLPRHIMNELIETERLYVEELQSIMEGYAAELDNTELSPLIPAALENKKDVLFGNLPEIYEFHNRTFFKELENCMERPELVGTCFLKRKEELQIYEKYCQNKPRSEALWRQCGDSLFFQECQKKLDHKLSLDAYLLKPVQRITKYQLMEMLKCSKNQEGTAELEEALATMLDIINELGKLLMQGSFNVWTDHKKGHSKVKDLARFKPMQRHLFLYNKMLLFCKKREETTDGHEKPSASYSFKHSLKMSAVGITENVKGDIKKFEVWYNGREEVYIIQAPSMDVKNMWVSEIRKVLTGQLEACRADASATNNPDHNGALARKRFTLQGLSNRRSLPSGKEAMTSPLTCSPCPYHHSILTIDLGFIPSFEEVPLIVMNQSREKVGLLKAICSFSLAIALPSLPPSLLFFSEPSSKETDVARRFSVASSISVSATSRTKGPPSSNVRKTKRHEIKSDPTPFGYEDTLRGAIPAVSRHKGTTSTDSAVPRSTSQPGWTQRCLPSMDTEDFETIHSSAEELSNSSDGEEESSNKNDHDRFRVQLTYESRTAQDLSLESGDLVQFLEEAEDGHWPVKNLITQKTGLVPPSILQTAAGDIFSDMCTAALSDSEENENPTCGDVSQDSR
ncbi:unnamed protein product [Coregonus sp. 'balchen']|nr:unnamed protein product [Coregonus sp. 'balchen']